MLFWAANPKQNSMTFCATVNISKHWFICSLRNGRSIKAQRNNLRSSWHSISSFFTGSISSGVHTTAARMSEDELRMPDHPLQPGQVLRIYSMRMCPYAQRARLILNAKNIPHDLVNVDLNNKPDWFFDLNPYGEVPVILHKGGVVYESLIAAEYLEEAFPKPRLYSEDPLIRSQEKIYFNHWTKKGIPAFYSLLKMGCLDPEQSQRLEDHIKVMDTYLKKLNKPYFHGDKVGFADYMIWPWFERMPMLKNITDFEISREKYPNITAWMDKMLKDETVIKSMSDLKLMTKHYAHYRTGKPDFTLGAKKPAAVQEALENLDGMRDPATRDRQK